jgi:hypothetical protein
MSYPQPQGWPPYGYGPQIPHPYRKQSRGKGFAVASILLGVVGCFASLVGFGFFTMPIMAVGLALGIVALWDARKVRRSGKAAAVTGIVLNALALVLTFAWIVFLIVGLFAGGELS